MVSVHCDVWSRPPLPESTSRRHLLPSIGASSPEHLNLTPLRTPHLPRETSPSYLKYFPLAPNHRANQTLIGIKSFLANLGFAVLLLVFGVLLLLLLLLSRFSRVRLCATPETAAHQAPPSLGFSRQEHRSGLPSPSLMHESEK